MIDRKSYVPGPASASLQSREGELWTIVLIKELRHAPELVWTAITEPGHLKEWAPFDADVSLGNQGATVQLTTVGAPSPHVTETKVTRADPPRRLEYSWGGNAMRWELEPQDAGTRLTLWAAIDHHYVAMGASGWHLCLDVLGYFLDETPLGRNVGPEAMGFAGWQTLHAAYAQKFGSRSDK